MHIMTYFINPSSYFRNVLYINRKILYLSFLPGGSFGNLFVSHVLIPCITPLHICKIDVQIACATSPVLLLWFCTFGLPLVSIPVESYFWPAIQLLWRYLNVIRFMDSPKNKSFFGRRIHYFPVKMIKSYSWRWTILRITGTYHLALY